MEITWLGHSCFRLKGKQATVITDPVPPQTGYSFSRIGADVVCLSHQKPEEAGLERISGEPYVVCGPGEYEIHNVLIIGVPCYQDDAKGSIRGKNTAYALEIEELSICHLGSLGHLLTDEQIETIGNVDILLIPVGGNITINAAQAARLIRTIEPKIVIPMHYKTPAVDMEIDGVEKFLSETGSQGMAPLPKLNITKSNLPLSMQVYLLDYPA